MAERSIAKERALWAFLWWLTAVVCALIVFFVMSMIVKDDPAAGIVFGGVTFMLVGLLLAFNGPGPGPNPELAPRQHGRGEPPYADPGAMHPPAAERAAVAERAPAAAPAAAPIAVPVAAPVAAPVAVPPAEREAPGPGAPISERVRDAARAAGEAARALGDAPPAASPVVPAVRPEGLAAPAEGGADDLKRIRGVGPKLEQLLHSLGIYHFRQIAAWGPGEVAWMDSNLEGFFGRVTRDDWVGQAGILAAGGETEHSRRVDRGEST
jgi:NADH-quinone oxidoreductase subunit E